jgi:hypothetical protein
MNYAIEVLEKEKTLLLKCLTDWDVKEYPEALKDRNNKIKDIEKAIQTLITKQSLIYLMNEKG